MSDKKVIDEMREALIMAEKEMCNATFHLKGTTNGLRLARAIKYSQAAIRLGFGWEPTAQYAGERPPDRPENTGGRQCGG